MKFRTKKNQKSQDYDEYLAYEESEQALMTEDLGKDLDKEAYPIDKTLYDSDLQRPKEDYGRRFPQETSNQIDIDTQEFRNNQSIYPDQETGTDATPHGDYEELTHDFIPEEVYPSRQAYLEAQKNSETSDQAIKESYEEENEQTSIRRAKYSAKVDRFLTNGIIVVGVLLIAVLLIAFLV